MHSFSHRTRTFSEEMSRCSACCRGMKVKKRAEFFWEWHPDIKYFICILPQFSVWSTCCRERWTPRVCESCCLQERCVRRFAAVFPAEFLEQEVRNIVDNTGYKSYQQGLWMSVVSIDNKSDGKHGDPNWMFTLWF